MKTCSKCKEVKPLTDFNINRSHSFGVGSFCRECMSLYGKERYKKNSSSIKSDVSRRRQEIHGWFLQIRSAISCAECGFSHPAAIDFHHTSRKNKDGEVTIMANKGYSKEVILAEIEKCIPLCANCHRILHYNEKARRSAD